MRTLALSPFLERPIICTTRKIKNPFYRSFPQSNAVSTHVGSFRLNTDKMWEKIEEDK